MAKPVVGMLVVGLCRDLPAFRRAGLAGFSACLALGDLGEFLAFLLAIGAHLGNHLCKSRNVWRIDGRERTQGGTSGNDLI